MSEFALGDHVQIICHDGAVFQGIITGFTEDYVLINGCGFPLADIRAMMPA
jgi:hypothetical protein